MWQFVVPPRPVALNVESGSWRHSESTIFNVYLVNLRLIIELKSTHFLYPDAFVDDKANFL